MSFRALRLAFIFQDPAPLRTNMPREAAVLDTVALLSKQLQKDLLGRGIYLYDF